MYLLIDKPKGVTSHDVVDVVRRLSGVRRVGHGGTLDPNATGLLILGIGRESTKNLGQISKNATKDYEAEIRLGEERETDDSQGKAREVRYKRGKPPSENEIKKALVSFVGERKQIPPLYSAVKIKGKKAYQLARGGEKVTLKPRKVTIYSIKLIGYKHPVLKIKCQVSSGTYIRALARDLGRKLKQGAYLRQLKRTKIGKYLLKDAVKLNDINKDNWKNYMVNTIT